VNRGEVWLAEVGRKRRPVLVLTRSEVLDVRSLVTVAEITATIRGLAAEVEIDHEKIGLAQSSVMRRAPYPRAKHADTPGWHGRREYVGERLLGRQLRVGLLTRLVRS